MKYLLLITVFVAEMATELITKDASSTEIKKEITSENKNEPYQFDFLVSEV